MPISEAKTERQRELIGGIKKGMEGGKKEEEIAHDLGISRSYIQVLKKKAGLTSSGSEIMKWIEKDQWLSDWIDECKAERTKYGYAHVMRKYCESRGKTPIELLREAEEDNKKPFEEKALKHELIRFRKELRNGKITETTIKTYMAAILSFFRFHGVSLPEIKNGRVKNTNHKNEYSREKVREVINVCNPREKALFLCMFQSGLASNEVSHLRVKDLKEEMEGITILKLQRQKSGEFFTTFIGKDGTKAINDYLKLRNEGNLIPGRPDISKLAKVKSEEDYVFVTWDPVKQKWGKISVHHISRYMLNACQKLGWEIKTEGIKRYNPNRPHALRASFATILINEGRIPKFFVDHMLGHSLDATDEAYFNARKNELFKYYKEAEHLLSVSDLEKIPDSKYEELMIELHKRNGEITTLREEVDAMKQVRKKIDEVEEWSSPILEDPEVQNVLMKKIKEMKVKNG